MTNVPASGDRAIWTISRQLVDVATRISPFVGVHRISDDSGWLVGNTYLGVISGLPAKLISLLLLRGGLDVHQDLIECRTIKEPARGR
jgi:hypothetical protein